MYNFVKKFVGVAVFVCLLLITGMAVSVVAEEDVDGDADVQNESPSITIEEAPDMSPAPGATTDFVLEVSDSNSLEDIDEVELVISSQDESSGTLERYEYTFTWSGEDSWSSNPSGYIDVVEEPSDFTVEKDNWVFSVEVAEVAAPGTWDVDASVVDNDGAEDSSNTDDMDVSKYSSLSLVEDKLSYSVSPGESDDADLNADVVSNVDYDIDVSLDDWTGPDDWSIDAERMSVDGTDLSNTYTTIDSGGETSEETDFEKGHTNTFNMDFPNTLKEGQYSTVIYVQVVN